MVVMLALGGAAAAGWLGARRASALSASCYRVDGGTVLDAKTHLTWQQTLDDPSYAWTDAATHCAALTLAGGGWRVPSVKELTTLVDFSRFDPAIDPVAFPNTPSEFLWSSSPDANSSPPTAWGVNFTRGSGGVAPVAFQNRVRCVR